MTRAHPDRARDYLQHIIEAIDRACGYVAGMNAAAFERDMRTQDAVIRSLQIIGEAANKARVADPSLQSSAPDIPWDVMYGIRNRMIHDYFEVDLDVVWQTLQGDLPVLRSQIDALPWATALDRLMAWGHARESRYVTICNAHVVVSAAQDAAYGEIINASDMATPDGAPVAWMLRRQG